MTPDAHADLMSPGQLPIPGQLFDPSAGGGLTSFLPEMRLQSSHSAAHAIAPASPAAIISQVPGRQLDEYLSRSISPPPAVASVASPTAGLGPQIVITQTDRGSFKSAISEYQPGSRPISAVQYISSNLTGSAYPSAKTTRMMSAEPGSEYSELHSGEFEPPYSSVQNLNLDPVLEIAASIPGPSKPLPSAKSAPESVLPTHIFLPTAILDDPDEDIVAL